MLHYMKKRVFSFVKKIPPLVWHFMACLKTHENTKEPALHLLSRWVLETVEGNLHKKNPGILFFAPFFHTKKGALTSHHKGVLKGVGQKKNRILIYHHKLFTFTCPSIVGALFIWSFFLFVAIFFRIHFVFESFF